MPQPYFVPVRPKASRRTQSSGVLGSTSVTLRSPLTTSSVAFIGRRHLAFALRFEQPDGTSLGSSSSPFVFLFYPFVFNAAGHHGATPFHTGSLRSRWPSTPGRHVRGDPSTPLREACPESVEGLGVSPRLRFATLRVSAAARSCESQLARYRRAVLS